MPTGVAVGVDLGGTRVRVVASAAGWSRRVQTRAPSLTDLPGFLRRLWRRWGVSPGGGARVWGGRAGVDPA